MARCFIIEEEEEEEGGSSSFEFSPEPRDPKQLAPSVPKVGTYFITGKFSKAVEKKI